MDQKNIKKLERTWNNIMATEKFTPFENEGMQLIKKGINLIKESQPSMIEKIESAFENS